MQDTNTPQDIVEINEANAKQWLVDESFKRPVLIDFWADWCGPCKSLMPILEKLAGEFRGQFLLAKVNADEQQMIAAQFGVRSLPTVMIMQDGQPVDGFAGAQTEVEVRELLEKYLPKPWDDLLEKGRALWRKVIIRKSSACCAKPTLPPSSSRTLPAHWPKHCWSASVMTKRRRC